MTGRGQEIQEWNETGYLPLVFSADWQVAVLNWESSFDLDKLGDVERYNLTITRDAGWITIENRDTHLQDCQYRKSSLTELN